MLQVDSQVSRNYDRLGSLRRCCNVAQRHADASQQLPRAERLGQVVVGTLLEGSDLVTFAAARGEHHDGSAGVGADRADDLQAIKVRQAKVEQNQVRPVA